MRTFYFVQRSLQDAKDISGNQKKRSLTSLLAKQVKRSALAFMIIFHGFFAFGKLPSPATPFNVSLSSSPTISFSNNSGFADNIAGDGEGGSIAISDLNIQVMPINSSGTKLTGEPLEFHDDWTGYPSIITYGSINPHYGWSIKSDNGDNFSLEAVGFLDWGAFSGETFVVQAFSNNSSLGTVTFSGNTTGDMVVLTNTGILSNIFQNVDEVRIYKQDGADAWTSLNNIKVTSPSAVLPVSGMNFTAGEINGSVELKWSTTTEEGTKDFEVQHSTEGNRWSSIGRKMAAGNSHTVQAYSFVHLTPVTGSNYYRLLQRDRNGKEQYSKVVAVSVAAKEKGLGIYPNPVINKQAQVRLQKEALVQVYNKAGNLVWQQKLPAGMHTLSLKHLATGFYTIKAGTETGRIVIQ